MRETYDLFPETKIANASKTIRSGTFTDNMKLPIHKWFRYSAGFSAEWVKDVIVKSERKIDKIIILDPFAGSGTTLLAAEHLGVKAYGFESHPFIFRIAKTKLLWHKIDSCEYMRAAATLLQAAKRESISISENVPALLAKCYSKEYLEKLFSLKQAFLKKEVGEYISELLWLTITSILRACSYVGTAQWQYVLPNKAKTKVLDPYTAFWAKVEQIASDIEFVKETHKPTSEIIQWDARLESSIPKNSIDMVITSPPYPNNYDYADATRLEMTFWDEIKGWGDLQGKVRQYIIRSCSQHSAADKLNLDEILESSLLKSIHDEITVACNELAAIRLTKGGKKTYHTMIAAYFLDISKIFSELRSICRPGAQLCFVIGDSAPYGVHIPVEKWLGELAIQSGFLSYSFEKIRDRNIKWKNRTHDIPLHEGRLWIEG